MPAPDLQTDERWIPVALLLRPQGRRGELLADPLTDLHEIFAPGSEFRLSATPEAVPQAPAVTLENAWQPQGRNAARLVLKLQGVDTISAAEALEAKTLYLPGARWPSLAEDTFLVGDLIGCALLDGDQRLGTVTDLQFPIGPDGRTRLADAADLLVIEPDAAPPDTEPVLVPFIKAWLLGVDLGSKEIRMNLPSGLFASLGAPDLPEASEALQIDGTPETDEE